MYRIFTGEIPNLLSNNYTRQPLLSFNPNPNSNFIREGNNSCKTAGRLGWETSEVSLSDQDSEFLRGRDLTRPGSGNAAWSALTLHKRAAGRRFLTVPTISLPPNIIALLIPVQPAQPFIRSASPQEKKSIFGAKSPPPSWKVSLAWKHCGTRRDSATLNARSSRQRSSSTAHRKKIKDLRTNSKSTAKNTQLAYLI